MARMGYDRDADLGVLKAIIDFSRRDIPGLTPLNKSAL
jgi:hypothetical protein